VHLRDILDLVDVGVHGALDELLLPSPREALNKHVTELRLYRQLGWRLLLHGYLLGRINRFTTHADLLPICHDRVNRVEMLRHHEVCATSWHVLQDTVLEDPRLLIEHRAVDEAVLGRDALHRRPHRLELSLYKLGLVARILTVVLVCAANIAPLVARAVGRVNGHRFV
jgi:hypothetical protein